jgi:hypothetical protein
MRTKPALIALVLATSLLSGCGLGTAPDTANMRPAGNGVDAKVDGLIVDDTTVVADATTGNLTLSATIINRAKDTNAVVSIMINNQVATLNPTEISLAPDAVVRFGFNPDAHADLIQSVKKAGDITNVTYFFANGEVLNVICLVVSNSLPEYSSIKPVLA